MASKLKSKASAAGLNLPNEVDKYLKYMTNVESCSDLTIKAYRLDLSQAFPELQNREKFAGWPEAELLRRARQAMTRWGSLSPASRNRKSATLKSFFGYLYQQGLIAKDLAGQIPSPKVPKKLPHFISVDEVLAILKSFDRDEKKTAHGAQEKLLFLLLYGGGLRVSEACTLRWKDVDFGAHILRIKGKGNKERIVALPKNLLPLLKREKKGGEFVWGDEALNTRVAYEWIRSRGVKAGLLRPIHPHALRHSFATHLLSSGANLRTLQELLGHESLQATEKYTHLDVNQLARTMEKHHPMGSKK